MVDCPDNGPYPWEKPLERALPTGWIDCECGTRIYGYWVADAVLFDLDKHCEETGCER